MPAATDVVMLGVVGLPLVAILGAKESPLKNVDLAVKLLGFVVLLLCTVSPGGFEYHILEWGIYQFK